VITEELWTGRCLCHGIDVTGVRGTVAQPKPFYPVSLFGGPRVRCWAVVDGGVHDVPVKALRPVEEV
jgi:hypothetical protein